MLKVIFGESWLKFARTMLLCGVSRPFSPLAQNNPKRTGQKGHKSTKNILKF